MKEYISIDNLQKIRKNILQPMVEAFGIKAYLVGGCVRTIKYGCGEINDIDIVCTNANELVEGLLQYCDAHGVDHGVNRMENGHATVVNVNYQQFTGDCFSIAPISISFEISQLNMKVSPIFGMVLHWDAKHRDFTCNAWYLPIHEDGEPFSPIANEYSVYSPKGRVLIPCGIRTFIDNPLRIFRAMDMISRGYHPSAGLALDIQRSLREIEHTPELRGSMLGIVHKIFDGLAHGERCVKDVIYAFNYMAELGVWEKLIDDDFDRMKRCIHISKYHNDSVWQHTMDVIYYMATLSTVGANGCSYKPTAYDYWAAFLHDIGKPESLTVDANGTTHFYGHHIISKSIAEGILKDSPVSKTMTSYILKLIAHHMDTKPFGDEPIKYSQYKHIRRLMWQLGDMAFNHFLILNQADCAASERTENKNTINVVRAVKDMAYNRGESAWECYKLPVTGNDIKEYIPDIPGKGIGICLDQLYKVTFSRPSDYETPEQCIHYIQTLIKTGWLRDMLAKDKHVEFETPFTKHQTPVKTNE